VTNFAAVVGTWTAKVGRYRTTKTVTTGSPEAYTMTCEVGGQVLRSSPLTIARGQALTVDPCGTGTVKAKPKHKPKAKKKSCKANARHKHGKARKRALKRCKAKARARHKRTQG
jgi:hypothetical protein